MGAGVGVGSGVGVREGAGIREGAGWGVCPGEWRRTSAVKAVMDSRTTASAAAGISQAREGEALLFPVYTAGTSVV